MNPSRWKLWLVVFAALLCGYAVAWLLGAQGHAQAGAWVQRGFALLQVAWLIVGLWTWRELQAVRVAWLLAMLAVAAQLFAAMGWRGAQVAALGTMGMVALFIAGLWLVRAVLSAGSPVLGVARTVVDEAVRMKIALVFVVGVVVLIPALPLVLDDEMMLKYRVQAFLSWSVMLNGLLLSLMTVFLACSTVTGEVSRRIIYLTLTKPVSRLQYLAGKWLGVVLLNLVLVAVTGLGIYTFVELLRLEPGKDEIDKRSVDDQVLVAREVIAPSPPSPAAMTRAYDEQLRRLQAEDPDVYGKEGDPAPASVRNEIEKRLIARWHTIGPRASQAYVFTGVQRARDFTETVQLRIRPKASQPPPDEMARLALRVNGRLDPLSPRVLVQGKVHMIDIPTSLIDEEGRLTIEILNAMDPQVFATDISFSHGEGLLLFYTIGGFEMNLVKGMFLVWLKLAFLAMLGIAAGSFLGFPVAALLSIMVYIVSTTKGFHVEALGYFAAVPDSSLPTWQWIVRLKDIVVDNFYKGDLWKTVKLVTVLLGRAFVAVVPNFSAYDAAANLAEGRAMTLTMLRNAVLSVGLLSTGACALVAWALFRRRELARVTV